MNISTGSYRALAAICAFNTSALPLKLNINYSSSWRNNAALKHSAFTKLIISNLQQNTCQSFTKQTEKVVHRVSSRWPSEEDDVLGSSSSSQLSFITGQRQSSRAKQENTKYRAQVYFIHPVTESPSFMRRFSLWRVWRRFESSFRTNQWPK